MKYINGHDLPEHIQHTLKGVVVSSDTAHITTRFGNAVVISLEEYEALRALRDNAPMAWCGVRPGRELDGLLRDEIDF